jgi:hypothetical protein
LNEKLEDCPKDSYTEQVVLIFSDKVSSMKFEVAILTKQTASN